MYRALTIARYIIEKCNEKNKTISNLKLQKILYFVQANFLVSKNQPCFAEQIEAWDFGPVVPEVYREYKIYGGASIPAFFRSGVISNIAADDKKLIDEMVDSCANYSASALVEITHHQTPWVEAHNKPGKNNVITNESIRKFFAEG